MASMWWSLLFAYLVALCLALPKNMYNKKLLKAIFTLPKVLFYMTFSFFTLKGANKSFIHTAHTKVSVDEDIYM